MLVLTSSFTAVGEDFTNAISAFLQHRIKVEKRNVGIVVGLADEHGSRIVSYGKSDTGTGQDVNGDTVFGICSVTKTFTALLLQDMVEHGEMNLDDPVAKYLPVSVTMPTRNSKEITLRQLATHSSGLPPWPEEMNAGRMDKVFDHYTAEMFYADLSGYALTRDPGTEFEYSSVGLGLLGHVITHKAGTQLRSARGGADLPVVEDGQHRHDADTGTDSPNDAGVQRTRLHGVEPGARPLDEWPAE